MYCPVRSQRNQGEKRRQRASRPRHPPGPGPTADCPPITTLIAGSGCQVSQPLPVGSRAVPPRSSDSASRLSDGTSRPRRQVASSVRRARRRWMTEDLGPAPATPVPAHQSPGVWRGGRPGRTSDPEAAPLAAGATAARRGRCPVQGRLSAHRVVQPPPFHEGDEVATEPVFGARGAAHGSPHGEVRVRRGADVAGRPGYPPGHGSATSASVARSSFAEITVVSRGACPRTSATLFRETPARTIWVAAACQTHAPPAGGS